MACTVERAMTIDIALDTKGQTRKHVEDIVEAILRQNNAIECGIMARLTMELNPSTQREPTAELKKLGVLSVDKTTD